MACHSQSDVQSVRVSVSGVHVYGCLLSSGRFDRHSSIDSFYAQYSVLRVLAYLASVMLLLCTCPVAVLLAWAVQVHGGGFLNKWPQERAWGELKQAFGL